MNNATANTFAGVVQNGTGGVLALTKSAGGLLNKLQSISVVRFAIDEGIPPARLAATGFADNQPIDHGSGDEAYRRNRRIELKLTER